MKKILLALPVIIMTVLARGEGKQGIVTLSTESKIIYDICFSQKGSIIAIPDNKSIKLYNTSTGQMIKELGKEHKSQILTLDISKDSSLIVSGGKDSTIILWDLIAGKKIRSLNYHHGLVTILKFSPDGRYIASGGTDHKVVIYDVSNNRIASEFTDHKDDVTCLAFSPDGKFLASGGGDKIITIYQCETPGLVVTLAGHKNWVRDLSFSHDGKSLVSCGDDASILKWDFSDPGNIRNISVKKDGHNWILCLDNSEDDETYALADVTGSVKVLWTRGIYTGNLNVPVMRIAFKPGSGNLVVIAVATRGKGVLLIDGSGLKLQTKKKYNFYPFKS